jgi:hypothetical protein
MEDGVEGDKYSRMEQVSELHPLSNIRHAVAGVALRAKASNSDVHCVGTLQDGLFGNDGIARWAEQFEGVRGQRHGVGTAGSQASRAVTRNSRVVCGPDQPPKYCIGIQTKGHVELAT